MTNVTNRFAYDNEGFGQKTAIEPSWKLSHRLGLCSGPNWGAHDTPLDPQSAKKGDYTPFHSPSPSNPVAFRYRCLCCRAVSSPLVAGRYFDYVYAHRPTDVHQRCCKLLAKLRRRKRASADMTTSVIGCRTGVLIIGLVTVSIEREQTNDNNAVETQDTQAIAKHKHDQVAYSPINCTLMIMAVWSFPGFLHR